MTDKIRLDALFEVAYGTKFDLKQMRQTTVDDDKGISFVSRSRQNLGISAYVKPYKDVPPLEAGLITVALGGSYLLSAFIQERPFYTAQNVAILTPRKALTFTQKMFYCLCLEKNRFRYSAFGREANRTLGLIRVPKAIPESFQEIQLECSSPVAAPILDICLDLTSVEWKDFRLCDLFSISGTKTTPLAQLKSYGAGNSPYVTTKASNNGVHDFYDHATEQGQVLVVDSAVLGYCSYQRDDFSASDHVEKLTPKFDMNKYISIFLATIINHNQYRFSYGRKACQERLRSAWIKLPSTMDGKPDWEFMDKYIQSLPFSRSL